MDKWIKKLRQISDRLDRDKNHFICDPIHGSEISRGFQFISEGFDELSKLTNVDKINYLIDSNDRMFNKIKELESSIQLLEERVEYLEKRSIFKNLFNYR